MGSLCRLRRSGRRRPSDRAWSCSWPPSFSIRVGTTELGMSSSWRAFRAKPARDVGVVAQGVLHRRPRSVGLFGCSTSLSVSWRLGVSAVQGARARGHIPQGVLQFSAVDHAPLSASSCCKHARLLLGGASCVSGSGAAGVVLRCRGGPSTPIAQCRRRLLRQTPGLSFFRRRCLCTFQVDLRFATQARGAIDLFRQRRARPRTRCQDRDHQAWASQEKV